MVTLEITWFDTNLFLLYLFIYSFCGNITRKIKLKINYLLHKVWVTVHYYYCKMSVLFIYLFLVMSKTFHLDFGFYEMVLAKPDFSWTQGLCFVRKCLNTWSEWYSVFAAIDYFILNRIYITNNYRRCSFIFLFKCSVNFLSIQFRVISDQIVIGS